MLSVIRAVKYICKQCAKGERLRRLHRHNPSIEVVMTALNSSGSLAISCDLQIARSHKVTEVLECLGMNILESLIVKELAAILVSNVHLSFPSIQRRQSKHR